MFGIGTDAATGTPAPPPDPAGGLRAFDDAPAVRSAIYDHTLAAVKAYEPVKNTRYTLSLASADYADPPGVTPDERKKAILRNESLHRRLRGTFHLVDNATGSPVAEKTVTIAKVPRLTDDGTFVLRGSEYTLGNQLRLDPGMYTRHTHAGEAETHVNLPAGAGRTHHYTIDPKTGVFKVRVDQALTPLAPLLKAMGVHPKAMQAAWGHDLYQSNAIADDGAALDRLYGKFLGDKPLPPGSSKGEALAAALKAMTFDPEVNRRTVGAPHAALTGEAMLDATKKLLAVHRGEADPDDRDAMAFQRLLGPEDLISERVKQMGRALRPVLWRATHKGNLDPLQPDFLGPHLHAAVMHSGIGQAAEEVNPAELLGQATRATRLGVGGIPSADVAPSESRAVQPSHAGFIDPVFSPESSSAGLDMRLAGGARKGPDGRVYTRAVDRKTGKAEWLSARQMADAVVAFPGELDDPREGMARVVKNGRMDYVPAAEVTHALPTAEAMFNPLLNMVPLKFGSDPKRASMAARFLTQALALKDPEAPLVQVADTAGGGSFEQKYGRNLGAVRAAAAGTVVSATEGGVRVQHDDGTDKEYLLHRHMPYNRKSFSHQTPTVKPGDRVEKDGLVARSNFTDHEGTAALGANLRVAFMPAKGYSFEDAYVTSESAAKRLTSAHAYQHSVDFDHAVKNNKHAFVSLFPSAYPKAVLDTLDDDGVVKVGATVNKGDPIVLQARERERAHNRVARGRFGGYADQTETWGHHDPGVVTDVERTPKGVVVSVKSEHELREGDKLASRHGAKGLVGRIVPDHEMPHDAAGRPFDVLVNPLTVVTRGNPAQMAETALGKIAARTGKPYHVRDFRTAEEMAKYALGELRKHNLADTEDVYDPTAGRKIPNVFTGVSYFLKLHHTAEGKSQARGLGGYTQDGAPAKTGGDIGSAKRFALMDSQAVLSHGALNFRRDVGTVRSQKNQDYWAAFMAGHDPPEPRVSAHHERFLAKLRAGGLNPVRTGAQLQLMAMTDKDVDHLAGPHEVENGETVHWGEELKPVKGGLFDNGTTGGHGSNRWSAFPLHEPLPNPAFEEPIRRVLGLTEKRLRGVLAGDEDLNGKTGPGAVKDALAGLDLDKEVAAAKDLAGRRRGAGRDAAVKKWSVLEHARRLGIHPKDWVLSRVPVLPPAYRPVSLMQQTGRPLVADPNLLYKDLIDATQALKALHGRTADLKDERLAAYDALKAVVGLGDPITPKNQEREVKGVLKSVFGAHSPKYGAMQRQLLGSNVDTVGQGVVVPDPGLDMDEVGLPESKAWEAYRPFVVRRLVKGGVPGPRAADLVERQDPKARAALVEEMGERPVVMTRAPVLHKYGAMGFRPRLVKGEQIRTPVLVVKGFNMDYDGDAVSYHVPVSRDAVRDVYEKMLPSRNLLAAKNFRVHQKPANEFAAGLYQATADESAAPVRYFKDHRAMEAAYRRGEVTHDQRVVILHPDT